VSARGQVPFTYRVKICFVVIHVANLRTLNVHATLVSDCHEQLLGMHGQTSIPYVTDPLVVSTDKQCT
jgi:hypothetical protein